jgi:hypothetical protein
MATLIARWNDELTLRPYDGSRLAIAENANRKLSGALESDRPPTAAIPLSSFAKSAFSRRDFVSANYAPVHISGKSRVICEPLVQAGISPASKTLSLRANSVCERG